MALRLLQRIARQLAGQRDVKGVGVEDIRVAPARQHRPLFGRQCMGLAPRDFLGRGRGAKGVQRLHGGIRQRLDAGLALCVRVRNAPG
ncbi:hypothetical protein D3C78_1824640 [compost metagenome]